MTTARPTAALLAALLVAAPACAQRPRPAAAPAADTRPLAGYAAAAAARQRALEASAAARPSPDSARRHAGRLGAEPHVAGTAAQARTRDYVLAEMARWGLDTASRAYDVWLPHATAVRLWRVAPDTQELALGEPPVPGDAATALPQYPTVNGMSAPGDTAGEVVFANYGLAGDYAVLDSLGVSVRGRVVVARYGRSFRGIKAREAERRGAAALVIYSDPADDGYVRGDVYPEGPMRPPAGVQRGSVFNGTGDPTTPGYPSTAGARRVPLDSTPVPRIPVVPVSYGTAQQLLEGVRGGAVPQAWQGGLAFRYHAGPGPVRVRVRVEDDRATRAYKTIWNTLATVRGSEFPDEVVVIGGHRDAWGAGAGDNVSGITSILEAARAVGAELRAGRRPRRTLVFATWDAEEWGLIGSTEHVEDDSLRLQRFGVAYLNQDVAAQGASFGGGGSPSLRAVLRDVARTIADPSGRGSVYESWRRASGVADSLEPAMGDPGGGSDFAGFYNHLGIPHADWGFGGPAGIYHSAYDTPAWMGRFGDPGYAYHATAGRIAAAMMLRLANADVVPFDYVEYARTLRGHAIALDRTTAARGVRALAVDSALARMEAAARRFAAARDAALAAARPPARAALERANAELRQVERALTRPAGLRTRPWYRNLVFAADEDNGYATVVFPSVVEALRRGDTALATAEVADLARRVDEATRRIEGAERAVGGRR